MSQNEQHGMHEEPTMGGANTVAAHALNAWYGQEQVLHQIDLALAAQCITALIGPSGCGKSTFVRCLNRLHEAIPDARVRGKVLIGGIDIYARAIRPMDVRRYVGMVFQQPTPLPTRSIWDNVAIGARMNGLARGASLQEVVEHSLRQAALWDEVKDQLHAPATQLSGGQQQRLCIARTLTNQPRVLLMDEPCSALDPLSTLQIEELILALKESYTIVLVTHNTQQAARVADRTVFFLQGHVIEEGATKALFSRPQHQETEAYLTGRLG
jgi:phosphate transport system ATP-binding protein